MKSYNGHRSWAAWNVSLWISNDEGLYRLALDCIEQTRKDGKARPAYAANRMFHLYLKGERTPDGAKYTPLTIKLALQDLE